MNVLDLLYIPVGLVAAPFVMRKKRSGWDQRVGHVSAMLKESPSSQEGSGKLRVMLHAVSVGEVNALRSLVPELSQQAHVIVSATTDTGLAHAQTLFGSIDSCDVVRYPLDCSWMVRRFLDSVKPDVVGLVELEVWPNFINACTKGGVPIGIINGRLSARSFKGYRKIRFLLRSTFGRLRFVCAQDEQYADRLLAMGVHPDRLTVTGTMKWDAVDATGDVSHTQPSEKAIEIASAMGIDLGKPLIVAGSTAPGEEAMLHAAVSEDVQLLIAPRKVDRFQEAGDAVPGCVRRSTGEQRPGATRFVLDTIGELSAMYELADIVIIGRSFFDLFGSDPVEPAAMGKPVLIGPAHSDFEQAMRVLLDGDAIQVVDRHEVKAVVAGLLADPERRSAMGQRARACVRAQQGASGRHLEVLMSHAGDQNKE